MTRSGFPPPEQAKASSMPIDDGVRLEDDDSFQATGPQAIEPHPKDPVNPPQPGPGRAFALEHQQLMAKVNEFEMQRGPVSNAREDGGEQKSEDHMHPSTLSAGSPNR